MINEIHAEQLKQGPSKSLETKERGEIVKQIEAINTNLFSIPEMIYSIKGITNVRRVETALSMTKPSFIYKQRTGSNAS